jgi:3-deoxy-D-manno-octulosonic-acid transferase
MSVLLYQFALFFYRMAAHVASLTNEKARLFIDGRKNLLEYVVGCLQFEKRPRIWLHAASLGEYEQAVPLLKALKIKYPNHAFIVTFFSPSGYVPIAKKAEHDYVFYLPLDHKKNSFQFIQLLQPEAVFFIKYESWYFYLKYLNDLNIPTYLVSAIFNNNQMVFKWYGGIFRRMLNCYSHIMVQDEQSKLLLHKQSISKVSVVGDTRFDRVVEHALGTKSMDAIESFKASSKLLVAGSTWLRDERFLAQLQKIMGIDWKLIVVPHEINTAHILQIRRLFPSASLWSEENWRDSSTLIVDTIGLLNQIYASADLAWVGGGFDKDGVHNVIEPAVRAIPVLFGPVYKAYREANLLIENKLAYSCETIEEVLAAIHFYEIEFSTSEFNQKSATFFEQEKGASARILEMVTLKSYPL